jgi:hypothetical protein
MTVAASASAHPTRLKVALIQDIDRGSVAANLVQIETSVNAAAALGAKLVLLQELHNGPYFCQSQSVAEFDRAETIPGPSTQRLGALARAAGVVLVSSLFERRAAGLYHNTSVVFECDGSIAGRYRKMHIPDDPGFMEKFYFRVWPIKSCKSRAIRSRSAVFAKRATSSCDIRNSAVFFAELMFNRLPKNTPTDTSMGKL